MGGCNWLVLLFTAQLVLFSCFMITFFSMETRRQEEQREMQKELHRLRTDNLAKERKLIKLAERAESWRFDRGGESEDDAGGEFNEDEWSEESDEHPPGEDGTPYGAEALAPEEEALPAEKRAGCARLKEGWWVYEVCLGQHVRQFHAADAKAAFAENMLGMAPHACGAEEAGCHCMRLREDDAALSCHKAEEEYVRGDACPDRESTRSVTVKLVCREGEEAADSVLAEGALALVSVHEPETCR